MLEKIQAELLDYDGTLTPIVTDYRKAFLSDTMRDTLGRLAERNAVAVVSGRDLKDVQKLVGLDSIYYSGSHGFELAGRTIGVVGVGNVGTRVARKAETLGMRVLLNDPPRQRAVRTQLSAAA